MRIYGQIQDRIAEGKVHMTLIDPAAQAPEKAGDIASEADRAGTDFFMVGGSTDIDRERITNCVAEIKKSSRKPVIIFPGSSSMICSNADAIYFMSLLNSRSTEFVIGHQVMAAIPLSKLKLEKIPMGYIVVEPGMTVGRVGMADLVMRDQPERAVSYALAAEMFGMSLVYLEAGSGSPDHVPDQIIQEVKRNISIPLIVGGGIRTPEAAREVSSAGADIVVTGTVAEKAKDVFTILEPIISAIKHR